ncbi:hypothetical protein PRZ48_008345 [Zasmidium cellare]|uniref:Protein kinase domain-containing protein n=1 Tax=Zasmidium cellare TaxID=395010 RepID=A0ABR0EFK9_ZASCE|nr:hypothetical protein PRZ48_008345 [Zasmidium cellare]
MPTGLEEGAALLGLVGFSAGLFKACIEGLVILSKARSYGRNTSGMGLMLELELHKLYSWAVEAGLAQTPPSLRIGADQAVLVYRVLEHLKELILNVQKLRAVHGLHLQEEPDQLLLLDEADSAFGRLGLKSGDGCHSLVLNIFQQRDKPWKVLKWVTFDEQKARGLLESIRGFIHDLQQILDQSRQAKIMKAMDVILRSAVLNTVNEQDLDMIGSLPQIAPEEDEVAAAARFKKQALLLGIMDTRQPSTSSRPRTDSLIAAPRRKPSYPPMNPRYSHNDLVQRRLHSSHLEIGQRTGHKARLLARYDGKPVLLEFRQETGIDKELEKDRVGKVALFLADLDPSFHGLSCQGYVKVSGKFAYVFELEETLSQGPVQSVETSTEYMSLRELMDATPSPSLNLRLAFAITLLETSLQLHTSGWLHKEFRSDNLLFFQSGSSTLADFLSAKLRIMGYAHARADLPSEVMTEPLKSELEADLYRHPACLRQPRETFRRAFDMFSVGCIMIELGLWSSLKRLCETLQHRDIGEDEAVDHMNLRNQFLLVVGSEHGLILTDSLTTRLEASVGKTYTNVVKTLVRSQEGDDMLGTEVNCLATLRTLADMI